MTFRVKDCSGEGSPRKVGSEYIFKGHTKRHVIVSAHHVMADPEAGNHEVWVYYLENGKYFIEAAEKKKEGA